MGRAARDKPCRRLLTSARALHVRRRLNDTIRISQSIKAAIATRSPLPFELKVLEALLQGGWGAFSCSGAVTVLSPPGQPPARSVNGCGPGAHGPCRRKPPHSCPVPCCSGTLQRDLGRACSGRSACCLMHAGPCTQQLRMPPAGPPLLRPATRPVCFPAPPRRNVASLLQQGQAACDCGRDGAAAAQGAVSGWDG